jgi:glutamate synthase (NADPH/NADH) large chain
MDQTDGNQQGLYRPEFEHDSCGTGFITNINGHKSYHIIDDALTMLENMEHRGACGCDPLSGDGAGILIQLPHEFFMEECANLEINLPEPGEYGVGMIFLPKEPALKKACRVIITNAIEKMGLHKLGYRKVAVDSAAIGETARQAEPDVEQLFVSRPHHITNADDFERKLYILRRYINKTVNETVPAAGEYFYFTSLSCKTIIYKGQVTTYQLRQYFLDLNDPRIASGFAMIHSRFSTNTFPSWKLAQPFRLIAHNGEINTLTGNLNWFYAGLKSYVSSYFTAEEMEMLLPVIDNNQSDSACLDNIIEILLHTGRSLPHVMMMLIPEAWDGNEQMDPVKKPSTNSTLL